MKALFDAARWRLACLTSCVMVSMAGAPALAQQLGTARPVEVPVIQLIAGLALCSLAAFAIIAVMKKRAGGGAAPMSLLKWKVPGKAGAGGVKVQETHRLSVHADLCRFTADNREYLVILSAGSVTVLRDEPVSGGPAHTTSGGGP